MFDRMWLEGLVESSSVVDVLKRPVRKGLAVKALPESDSMFSM